MEVLVSLLMIVVWALVGHELAKYVNKNVRGVRFSPNWWALICALFGFAGLLWMAIWGVAKYIMNK